MSHDELLADINEAIQYEEDKQVWKALRAVVELHKPDVRKNCDLCTWITNGGFVVYEVCPTIRAIEKELNL